MAAFSKRHRRALAEDGLEVRVGDIVRGRISRLFRRHAWAYSETDETGWRYDTDTLEDLGRELRDLYGADHLPGDEESRGFAVFVENAPPECIFDAVELFVSPMQDSATFVGDLNTILAEEEMPWRMLDGEMVLLDETFARSQLAARADESIRQSGFGGANLELRRARNHVVDGDGRGAVHRAGSAFESVMMALLDVDRGKGAKLLQDLNRDGYFDDLPVDRRQSFIREVLQALPWMRNELGGHGQGETQVEISRPYAQLATDLASALCHFLITLKLEREGNLSPDLSTEATPEASSPVHKTPETASDFSFTAGSDDDIPF